MKKLLLISSLLIIISCSTENEKKSFNTKDANNLKIVKETISEDSLDNIYIESDTNKSEEVILNNNINKPLPPNGNEPITPNYNSLKYPTLVVFDKLCDEIISYTFNSENNTIEKNHSYPDCPSSDKFKGIFVTKIPNSLSDSLKTFLNSEIKNILKPVKNKNYVTYIK